MPSSRICLTRSTLTRVELSTSKVRRYLRKHAHGVKDSGQLQVDVDPKKLTMSDVEFLQMMSKKGSKTSMEQELQEAFKVCIHPRN